MIDFSSLFATDGFMPHGMCYLWRPGILAVHVGADSLIALAYLTIPFTLVHFARQRIDLRFNWVFWSFAIFIVACGASHLMEIWTIWFPMYWLSGAIKAITALVSVTTAILLVKIAPVALRLPTPAALVAANENLAREVVERKHAEQRVLEINATLEARVAERTQQLAAANLTLIHSNARFETLLRLTSQVIWTNNPEGRMEGAQPGWGAFTGQSFDDYQGFGWSAAVHPDDAQPTIDEWNRCVADRRAFLFEHRVRRHDGLYRTCTINATPVLNDEGTIREWVGVHIDITERRQQEDEIRAQEAKFRFLAESLPQMVWTALPDGALDYFNQRWCSYTGMTLEQTLGWGWGQVLHPDDLQNCIGVWSHSVATGDALEIEYRFRRASDNSYRWHLGRAVPFRDSHGATVKWFGTSTDIHDYKEAEARNLALQAELEDRVQQRTAELERVGKIAGVGGWSIGVASSAVYWSDETCRILDVQPGYRPTFDEAIGLYAPDSRAVIEAACQNCMANAVPFDVELQLTTPKKRGIWVRAVGEAQSEQGTVVRIFGAFQDITGRKLAERELFDQHELLRVTLNSIGDAVITTDAHGKVQSLNSIAALLTGWTVSESLGTPVEQVFDIVDAQTRQRTLELMNRALSNVVPAGTGMHTFLVARDGTEIGIEDSIAPIRDKTGQVVGSVLVFRDVSERQRAAQALGRANERFALAASAAGIGVWEWDLLSNELRWDEQMYRLYGREPLEGVEPYSLWATSLHAEDRGRAEREINEALRAGVNFDTEFRIVQPSGAIRHLKADAKILHDAAGAPIRMIGVNFDITARKQAELDLKQTSSLLRMVLDAANDLSIIATAPDLTIRVFNKGAERLLGYASADCIERATPMAFHDAAEVEARGLELSALLGRAVQGTGVFTEPATLDVPREWTYIRKDQRRVPVVLNMSAMFDDSGTLSGYMGFARDITRDREHEHSLQEAKSEAERANAAKSEFLANMSHEIRTPLNAVIGLGYLLEQTTLTQDQRQYLSKIQFAGRSLLSVVNNVLDLSKIEAGEVLLENESFNFPELLLNISQMLAAQASAKGIELIVRPASDLPRLVVGDASRLRQVLINLLNNAIKFTDAGHVELQASCTEQGSDRIRLRCEVIDTGIGIEAAAIKRMFVPFTQADASTTRRFGGTGLGLSIARHLVELMSGEIDATSTVGLGSKFWFEIPLGLAHSVDSTSSLRSLRIAIVDSGSDAADGMTGMVRAMGWSPQVVPTGEELLSYLNGAPPNAWPHVLMAQLQLSDMDVHQLIARLQNECSHGEMPSVIVVADSAQSYLTHQPRIRATDTLLALPLSSSALFNAVNAAVSKRTDNSEHMLNFTDTDVLHAQWLMGVRVLVVDDSALNREVAQGILQSQGAIVNTCSDGRQAVEHVRAHHQQLDVVLMDVQMPILDGNEATQLIRGELNLQQLPIIALTAGALPSERQRALRAGMNAIVTKPFDPQVLIRKIRYLVEQAREGPIPIAILDRKRVPNAAYGPLIASIDAGVVQQMFGEDLPLFKSALSRLLRDYAEFAAPLATALDTPSTRSQLKARVHELRGSAGLIGATRIMGLAGAAETALEQGRSTAILAPILLQLTAAFCEMREEAEIWLAKHAKRDAPAGAHAGARSNIGIADLDELHALLDSRNLAALDKFSALSSHLQELLGAVRFDRLRDAMDNLDFRLGAQLLREPPGPILA